MIEMRGGKIIGEGVDGCVFIGDAVPCRDGSNLGINSKNDRYVKKIVKTTDKEPVYLKIASVLLGPEYASKYITALHGECKPANIKNPPSRKNRNEFISSRKNILSWTPRGMACGDLKDRIIRDESLSENYKVLYVSRYAMDIIRWCKLNVEEHIPYKTVVKQLEHAIPTFIQVLQKLYQGKTAQLIHVDLHSGNMFVRLNPLELGIADFGRCVFRRYGGSEERSAVSFYGEYLIGHLSRQYLYTGYRQIPLEVRLLNYCYHRKLELAHPVDLITIWEHDPDVTQTAAGSKDIIVLNRGIMLKYLLTKPLFIAMIETLQSISRKLRANPTDPIKLVQSMNQTDKMVMEFLLTRYSIISPINSITEEFMNAYPTEPMLLPSGVGSNALIRYVIYAILLPYDHASMSLATRLKAVQDSDMGQLWSSVASPAF